MHCVNEERTQVVERDRDRRSVNRSTQSIDQIETLTLLVVSNDGSGESLSDGVDLRSLTSSLDIDSDVDSSESRGSQEQDGLEHLVSENLWLDQFDGASVHLDETSSLLAQCRSNGGSLQDQSA